MLPVALGIGGVGAFLGWRYLQSGDRKKLREQFDMWRKRLSPAAQTASQTTNEEADPDVEESYRNMDNELKDFDERLRRTKRR